MNVGLVISVLVLKQRKGERFVMAKYELHALSTSNEFPLTVPTEWQWIYNNERTNMSIDGITPAMKLKSHKKFTDEPD
jgi:hypothetical protein